MDFQKNKNITAWGLLMLLQKKALQNNSKIKFNSELIIQLLKRSEKSLEMRSDLLNYQVKNKELSKENSVLNDLHNKLLSFLKLISEEDMALIEGNVLEFPTMENNKKHETIYSFEECLAKTINGDISYNKQHQYFCSTEFRDKLIEYYSNIEEYEKCSEIKNLERCS